MIARRIVAGLIALATAGTLAACGGDDDRDSRDTGAATDLMPAAEGTTTYPLTLDTAWGSSELAARPARVAAVTPSARDVEMLAALGVTPVVAPQTFQGLVWNEGLGEVASVYENQSSGITPFETVAEADPDVILAFGKDYSTEFDQLSAIAPVVSVATKEEAEARDWKPELARIAEALDLQDAGRQVVEDYDAWFADARKDNPQFAGKTATYLVQYPSDPGLVYFSKPGSDTESLLVNLGFVPNPLARGFTQGAKPTVSSEKLAEIDADAVVISNNTDSPEELEKLLTGTALYRNLDVVRQGHVAVLFNTGDGYDWEGKHYDGNLAWALAQGGPLGTRFAAEQLIPILDRALA